MNFVHLHTHSHYSLLDGLSKVDQLVRAAKEYGMPALALTDHGVMYGAIEFYQKCQAAGIKPIIGCEVYLAPNGRLNKRSKVDDVRYHLILLAKNNTGYKNLIKLTSIAHLEGFYYKPRIDWEVLEQYHEGLIACSACLNGEIPRAILSGDKKKIEETIERYHRLFGDDFYLELQDHPHLPEQQMVNRSLLEWSKKLNVPLTASNDVHYLRREDAEAHDVLLCLQTKHKKDDPDRMNMLEINASFRSPEEMRQIFADYPEALENTVKIAKQCNVEIELGKIKLPHFIVPQGQTADEYLEALVRQGIPRRYGQTPPAGLTERLEYELGVIKKTGFASYFLIVADFVNWAKDNGIVVGPGRGSAAGSIIAYLTNITNIDPMKYDLLFERFLNPERITMPDIDLDFADTRRDEVIRYVEDKYGKDHVAQIVTFGTMAARVAVRDVGRVLNLPYAYCDKIAKLIPIFTTLDQALKKEPELREMYEQDPDAKRLIDTAKKLEGVCRHTSTHACGVLITPEPLTEYVPIQYAASGDETIISQYSLHPIEDLGLLKMDFLGLKNLTILEQTIEIIEKIHGVKVDLDHLPLEDKKTFRLLRRAETTGVFQLESSGMKRYLKQLKPTELEDIIAMVSLYRPGPIELIPDFIDRKHGKKTIEYLHPKLEPILKNTYGVAVYQEQVLRIARDLAGFTLGEADVLRKAVGKKIVTLLKEQKEKFVSGCVKNGLSKTTAEKIFDFIEPFARYGFNRAHAACYALIAYQTAYFKANYPVEFMASLLTSDQDNMDRIVIEVGECEQMGIKVLPPDVNESFSTFTAVAESLGTDSPRIRFGLLAIKNFGEGVSRAIIHERRERGPYQSFEDLLIRVRSKDLNKKSLESLAKSGALDNLIERNQVIHNIDRILNFVKEINQQQDSAQVSLFSESVAGPQFSLQLESAPAADKQERLVWEKEFLGLYLSDHPYKEFAKELQDHVIGCHQLTEQFRAGTEAVRIAGVITRMKKVFTRGGEAMLFVRLEDISGSAELIVFPKVMQAMAQLWQEDRLVIVEGRLSDKDGEVKVVVHRAAVLSAETLPQLIGEYSGPVRLMGRNGFGRDNGSSAPLQRSGSRALDGTVVIKFSQKPDQQLAERLKTIFSTYPGDYRIYLLIQNQGRWQKMQTPFTVAYSPEMKERIEELVGWGSVRLDG
ncbi:DNA polymerase III subunit alpha [Candidatus Falkowbacteria bacterium]|nr:DNA polymerase III subunit alpha [Candidatus Falkowbacteria bacterium]